MDRPLDLATRKIGVVLNTASGSCTDESAPEIEGIFSEYGLTPVRVWCGPADELKQAFAEVEKRELDVLVALGGDGTIRSAAELAGADGLLLLPLPGGTMNVLPRALYGEGSWQEVLRRVLVRPTTRSISGGVVAGHRFFISAMCGAPVLWTHVREDFRDYQIGAAIEHGKEALEHMFSDKLQYHFNEMHEGETEAVAITCPLVSSALDDEREVLEAAVIDLNHAGDMLALATAAAFGEWRETKHVSIVATKSITLSSKTALPIILDGEPVDVGQRATVEFIPHAFTALVPIDEVLS